MISLPRQPVIYLLMAHRGSTSLKAHKYAQRYRIKYKKIKVLNSTEIYLALLLYVFVFFPFQLNEMDYCFEEKNGMKAIHMFPKKQISV